MNKKLSGFEITIVAILLPVLIYFNDEIEWILLSIAMIGFLSPAIYFLGWYLRR